MTVEGAVQGHPLRHVGNSHLSTTPTVTGWRHITEPWSLICSFLLSLSAFRSLLLYYFTLFLILLFNHPVFAARGDRLVWFA
jgi:hypothetical protein